MITLRDPILLFALIAVSGCGDQQPPPPPADPPSPTGRTWPSTRKTEQGNFSVTIQPTEGSIERNQHFSLDVSVTPAGDDKSIGEDFEVTADADMPAHRHGMNTRPETAKTGDNTYRVDGMLFHMSGDWVITVRVGSGVKAEQASFPVSVE